MFPIQRSIQPAFHESLSGIRDRVFAHTESLRNLSVRPVWTVGIHFQQLLRVSNLSCACPSLVTNAVNSSRSCSVSRTMYFFPITPSRRLSSSRILLSATGAFNLDTTLIS